MRSRCQTGMLDLRKGSRTKDRIDPAWNPVALAAEVRDDSEVVGGVGWDLGLEDRCDLRMLTVRQKLCVGNGLDS